MKAASNLNQGTVAVRTRAELLGARIFDIVSVTNRGERNYEMRVLGLEKIRCRTA